jgi:diguanylate cyclase (GGDEF)-like protein
MIHIIAIISENQEYINNLNKHDFKNKQIKFEIFNQISDFDFESINKYKLFIIEFELRNSMKLIKSLTDKEQKVIVISNKNDKDTYQQAYKFNIIDYFSIVDDLEAIYISYSIERICKNSKKEILIVDDSSLVRKSLRKNLENNNISQIHEAQNGAEAIEIIEKNREKNSNKCKIDLILTDYDMPILNGLEFVKQVRKIFSSDELPIIALSAYDKSNILSRFLKSGANDYLSKDFSRDEFICRLNLHLDTLEKNRKINNLAKTDYLTELPNRLSFYERASHVVDMAIRKNDSYSVAVIDIDFFKKVNDTYGHQVGDLALQTVAQALRNNVRSMDIIARFGGEEFNVLLPSTDEKTAFFVMERFRNEIKTIKIFYGDNEEDFFTLTVSIGISTGVERNIEVLIEKADANLYKAKSSGRDKVIN